MSVTGKECGNQPTKWPPSTRRSLKIVQLRSSLSNGAAHLFCVSWFEDHHRDFKGSEGSQHDRDRALPRLILIDTIILAICSCYPRQRQTPSVIENWGHHTKTVCNVAVCSGNDALPLSHSTCFEFCVAFSKVILTGWNGEREVSDGWLSGRGGKVALGGEKQAN